MLWKGIKVSTVESDRFPISSFFKVSFSLNSPHQYLEKKLKKINSSDKSSNYISCHIYGAVGMFGENLMIFYCRGFEKAEVLYCVCLLKGNSD